MIPEERIARYRADIEKLSRHVEKKPSPMKYTSISVYQGLMGYVIAIASMKGLRVYYPGESSLTRMSRLANRMVSAGVATVYPATSHGVLGWVMTAKEDTL